MPDKMKSMHGAAQTPMHGDLILVHLVPVNQTFTSIFSLIFHHNLFFGGGVLHLKFTGASILYNY